MDTLFYYINQDEQNEFSASVRDVSGKTVFSIDTTYALYLAQNGVDVRCAKSVLHYVYFLNDLNQSTREAS